MKKRLTIFSIFFFLISFFLTASVFASDDFKTIKIKDNYNDTKIIVVQYHNGIEYVNLTDIAKLMKLPGYLISTSNNSNNKVFLPIHNESSVFDSDNLNTDTVLCFSDTEDYAQIITCPLKENKRLFKLPLKHPVQFYSDEQILISLEDFKNIWGARIEWRGTYQREVLDYYPDLFYKYNVQAFLGALYVDPDVRTFEFKGIPIEFFNVPEEKIFFFMHTLMSSQQYFPLAFYDLFLDGQGVTKISVGEFKDKDTVIGSFIPLGKEIFINSELESEDWIIRTFLHELAHAFDYKNSPDIFSGYYSNSPQWKEAIIRDADYNGLKPEIKIDTLVKGYPYKGVILSNDLEEDFAKSVELFLSDTENFINK